MNTHGIVWFNWIQLLNPAVRECTWIYCYFTNMFMYCSCVSILSWGWAFYNPRIQGQHCHLCPPGALQKRKRRNRELVKALRQGVPSCQMDPVDPSTVGSMPLPVVFLAWPWHHWGSKPATMKSGMTDDIWWSILRNIDQHCLDPELMAPPCVLKHAGGVQANPLCTGVALPPIKGFAAPNQQIHCLFGVVTKILHGAPGSFQDFPFCIARCCSTA